MFSLPSTWPPVASRPKTPAAGSPRSNWARWRAYATTSPSGSGVRFTTFASGDGSTSRPATVAILPGASGSQGSRSTTPLQHLSNTSPTQNPLPVGEVSPTALQLGRPQTRMPKGSPSPTPLQVALLKNPTYETRRYENERKAFLVKGRQTGYLETRGRRASNAETTAHSTGTASHFRARRACSPTVRPSSMPVWPSGATGTLRGFSTTTSCTSSRSGSTGDRTASHGS